MKNKMAQLLGGFIGEDLSEPINISAPSISPATHGVESEAEEPPTKPRRKLNTTFTQRTIRIDKDLSRWMDELLFTIEGCNGRNVKQMNLGCLFDAAIKSFMRLPEEERAALISECERGKENAE